MEIKNLSIIGSGVMGSGVAQVSAVAGYDVVLQDINQQALERAKSDIQFSLGKLVAKSKITQEQANDALAGIKFTTDLNQAAVSADLIIEAVFEDIEVKQELFKKLETLSRSDAILSSNTSALPITEIASATYRGEKIVGIHFMNPVPLMKGVEIIRGQLTSDDTFESAMAYIRKIGKVPVQAVDYAGFIVSRLLDVLMNEAVKMVQEGNRPEDIDNAMKLCAGHPMGPCRLLDLVGAEIAMHGMETMARDFGDRYKPHPLLRKRVLAGLLGRKTGCGLYDYKQ
ncbi:3-hydroxyacyl-CoA dehydrogenase family protein [bacterium]|nr:3-hydroxyacyl-CoA dehydrogenase family protein [bacterium]